MVFADEDGLGLILDSKETELVSGIDRVALKLFDFRIGGSLTSGEKLGLGGLEEKSDR